MSLQDFSAKVTKGDRAGEVFQAKWDLPDTIQQAIDRFGEDVVYSHFRQSVTVALQAFMRQHIQKDGASSETVQKAVDTAGPEDTPWKPGLRAPAKPISEKIAELFAKLSEEERAELAEEYLSS